MKKFTRPEWLALAEQLHTIIMDEIAAAELNGEYYSIYPKLIIACEFFRMIRGEAFYESRPDLGIAQRTLYAYEDEIMQRVKEFESKIDVNDQKVKFYLTRAQKMFARS